MGEAAFRGDSMYMLPETFANRLATIRKLGYPVIPLSDAIDIVDGKVKPKSATVVITIDDGWYSTYAIMLKALEQARMPATLYCDTAQLQSGEPVAHMMARYVWRRGEAPEGTPAHDAYLRATDTGMAIAIRRTAVQDLAQHTGIDIGEYVSTRAFGYMSPNELRDLYARGIEVQPHTHNHTLGDQSLAVVARELAANRTALAALLDQPTEAFEHFCYPSGISSASAERALESLGVRSSTTTAPGLAFPGAPRHALPRFVDGEQVSPIEFEAELSGLTHILRTVAARLAAMLGPHRAEHGRARACAGVDCGRARFRQ